MSVSVCGGGGMLGFGGGIYDWAMLPLLMHSIEVMCHAICVLACLTSRLQMKMHVETQLLCANEKDM